MVFFNITCTHSFLFSFLFIEFDMEILCSDHGDSLFSENIQVIHFENEILPEICCSQEKYDVLSFVL